MRNKYVQIFCLEVRHNYYKSGECKNLSFIPDRKTKAFLNKYGILIRQSSSGVDIFAPTFEDESTEAFLTRIEKESGLTHLTLKMETGDALFKRFTVLPADWSGTLEYEAANKNDENELTPSFGVDNGSFATVKCALSELKSALVQEFIIKFDARQVFWDYYLINKNQSDLNSVAIKADNDTFFVKRGDILLQNGEMTTLVESAGAIQISELPPFKCDLVVEKDGEEVTLFRNLPGPDISHLTFEERSGKKRAVVPIYIYI